ncbi:LAQU0S47e00100g1_1 [Lachancea quebecensis]|uniref:LAQU0S47e00100g1_1 n=1 Tax=Lachancea quebecensis TaxID=1654605 RepID=A0A0P1L447_9SACH|nr:LAQU0S47e00100g1_1 [Lachancea quebecensis]
MTEDKAEERLIYVPNESGGNLRLPRDIFASRFQYDRVKYRILIIAVGLELSLCASTIVVASFLIYDGSSLAAFAVFSSFLCVLAILLTCIITIIGMEAITTPLFKVQFMKEIASTKPTTEIAEWDMIAARMNKFLHTGSSSEAPGYFYDGESCYSFFRRSYLLPYLRKKNPSQTQVETNLQQNMVDEVQPLVDQVLKAYEERVNEHWQCIINEGSSVENQAVDF